MTCFGINNEGQLVLDYYHEDTDQLEGANVYNGQKSVLWCNFRDAFPDKIKETYQDLRSNGVLNYDEMREQFITKGSDKWSESIYNEDADFKYISMLYSDNDASNLGQVRGTGEEHLEYFLENRFNYCDGKWYAPDYADDYVALRIYTPVDENGAPRTDLAVAANADITVTPYSYMYAGLRYKANGTLQQKRVSANEVTTFEAPNETFNDTETAIYGASQLSSLGDLSPLYCGSINVSKATKLTELIIGNDTEGYSNPNLNDLSVGTNNLLKVINVRNCPKLTDPLALAGCPNIEEIYAAGSAITGIDLANSGYLKVIELPATIANLTLKNQLYVESLTLEGYSAIKTINIENCPTVRSLDILGAATNVERVRLTNVNWTYDTAAEVLALADRNLAGIDENGANIDNMWIDGKCHIKSLTGADYLKVKEAFPYMNITYDTLTAQLIFMSEDGNTELTRQTIQNGGNGTDPIDAGTISKPTKESTAQYHFTYSGWSLTPGGVANVNALNKVEADRTVYVSFAKELRSYTVKFYNGTTLLQTSTVQYGGDAVYSGSTPVNNSTGNPDDFEFYGWKPAPTNIQGATDCYAQFYDLREITDDWSTIAQACLDGTATEKYAIGAFKMLDIGEVSLPYEFNHGSAVLYNGEIHILGSVVSEYRTSHYKWDGTKWVEVSTLPYEFYYGSAVVFNGEIHILGGSGSSSGKKKHYKWNGSEWVSVSTLPYMFRNGVAVVYNNEIHIMGSEESSYYTSHYKWNGSSWSEVGELPYSFYTASGFIYNNEIHVLGSYDSKYNTAHYKYDGSSWISVNTLPQKLSNGHALVIGTDIYIIQWDEFYKYDGTNWDTCPNVPANVYEGGSVVLDGNIYVMGSSVSGNERVFYSYDTETSKWSKVGITESIPMEIIAHNHDELADGGRRWVELTNEAGFSFEYCAAVVYNDAIHIMDNSKHYKYNGVEWVTMDASPLTVNMNTAVVYNGQIHAFCETTHYTYDDTNGWVELGGLLQGVKNGSAVVYNNCIHLFDGAQYMKSHCVYDGTSWTKMGVNTPNHVSGENAVVFNGELYIYDMGGSLYKWTGSGWDLKHSFSLNSNRHATFVYDDKLYLKSNRRVYCYDGSSIVETTSFPYCIVKTPTLVYRNELHQLGFLNTTNGTTNHKHWKWAGKGWKRVDSKEKDFNNKWFVYDDTIYYLYNKAVGTWDMKTAKGSSLPTLPIGCPGHGNLVVFNGKIHVFTVAGYQNNDKLHYIYDSETNSWLEGPATPDDNYSGTTFVYNDKLYHSYGTRYHTYDDVNGWSETVSVPHFPGDVSKMCIHNGELYYITNVAGCYGLYKNNLTDFEKVWTFPAININKINLCSLNGKIHIMGGVANKTAHYVYDGTEVKLLPKPLPYNAEILCGAFVYHNKLYYFGMGGFHMVYENPRATLTFLAKNLLKDDRQFHLNSSGYWSISDLRSWCNGEFYNSLPEDLQSAISKVIKVSDTGYTTQTLENVDDKVWICSKEELAGDTGYTVTGQGESYPVFTNNGSRMRTKVGSSDCYQYWTRSIVTNNIHNNWVVSNKGALVNENRAKTNAILPGFCI